MADLSSLPKVSVPTVCIRYCCRQQSKSFRTCKRVSTHVFQSFSKEQKQDRPSEDTPPNASDSAEQQIDDENAKTSSFYFPRLVQNLLWNASTSVSRGKTGCRMCKNTGWCTCQQCNGVRVSTRGTSSARKQMREQTAALDTSPRDARAGLITNRCSACRGAGVIECPACGGAGWLHN